MNLLLSSAHHLEGGDSRVALKTTKTASLSLVCLMTTLMQLCGVLRPSFSLRPYDVSSCAQTCGKNWHLVANDSTRFFDVDDQR